MAKADQKRVLALELGVGPWDMPSAGDGVMLEGIPIGVANLSATGILALIFIMLVVALLKGWVVVKMHYDKMEKAKDHWRGTADKNAETISMMAEAARESKVVGETVVKVMSAIQDQNRSTGGSS